MLTRTALFNDLMPDQPLEQLQTLLASKPVRKMDHYTYLVKAGPAEVAVMFFYSKIAAFRQDHVIVSTHGRDSAVTVDRLNKILGFLGLYVTLKGGIVTVHGAANGPFAGQSCALVDDVCIPYAGQLPTIAAPIDKYPRIKNYYYYQEFSDRDCTIPTGNVLAIDRAVTPELEDALECFGALTSEPNAPCYWHAVSKTILKMYYKRTGKMAAQKIHPRLFEGLSELAHRE